MTPYWLCYSYVLACVRKDKMVAERLDIHIEKIRILITITLLTTIMLLHNLIAVYREPWHS